MSLDNKIAIITGGTKGIGFAIAEALLKSGVKVFICGRNKIQLRSSLNILSEFGEVAGISCDVRDEEEIDAMFAECLKRFGSVDILINNAGVGIFGKTVEETSFIEFEYTLETNLYSVFHTCKKVIPLMKERNGGYIFNISSIAGQNAHPKMATYNASKYALNGFTEALMQEVRQDNIKVSLICPGSVNTTFGSQEVTDETSWQIHPNDIAEIVVDLLKINPRTLPSKVEIRPSKLPAK